MWSLLFFFWHKIYKRKRTFFDCQLKSEEEKQKFERSLLDIHKKHFYEKASVFSKNMQWFQWTFNVFCFAREKSDREKDLLRPENIEGFFAHKS